MTAAKPSSLSIWVYGCLAALAGMCVLGMVQSSTLEHWHIGIVCSLLFGLPLAILVLPVLSILFLVVRWFVNRSNRSYAVQRFILLAPWLLFVFFCLGTAVISAFPESRFCRVVLDPVPGSVKEIKVVGLNALLARRWMFHFRIDPAQAGEIVKKHELTQVPPFDFQEKISHDPFLREVSWARDIRYRDTALFYAHTEDAADGQSRRWTYLMVDPDSSYACFIQGYQR